MASAHLQIWQSRRVPVFAGQHDTHIETGEDYATLTLADIFAMEPGSQPKGRGLAFIPSTYNDHDARCHAVQRERGMFVALTGDIDKGDTPLSVVEALTREVAGGAAWLIYSSAHARPGNRRWRIVLPLDTPVPFMAWNDAQTAFFNFMEARGVTMDRALARAGQPVYLPNVPAVHHKTGEVLRGQDGSPLHYQRIASGVADPGLRLDRGPVATGMVEIARKREADDRERARLRAAAEHRFAGRASDDGESPIHRFNRANAVADLLMRYGYEQSPRRPEDWRSPIQTSDSYATRVMDGKWVSLSESDAAAGLGARPKTDAGCYGDAFDLFVHFEHGGNRTEALRQLHHEHRQELAYAKFGRPLFERAL